MVKTDTTRPTGRRDPWRAHRPAAAALILGLLVSIGAWWLVRGWETRQRAAQVSEQVAVSAQALTETLGNLVGDVQALAQFYAAADAVSADAFARFTQPILARHPGLLALEWVPRVPARDRTTFESQAQAEGLAGFRILERVGGEPRPAGARAELFPVLRVEPLAGNAAALGLDQGADPLRRPALEQARDTGQPAASAPLIPVRETVGQHRLIVYVPQGPAGVPGETAQARRDRVRGFAVGVLRLGDLMGRVIANLPPNTVDLVLLDPLTPGAAGVLDRHPARARLAGAPALDPAAVIQDPLGQEVPISVAGRTLVLRGAPAPGTTPTPLLSLTLPGGGLIISLGLAWLVRYHRAAQTRLRESERIEAALRESEARVRLVIEHAPAALAVFDRELRYIVASRRWLASD